MLSPQFFLLLCQLLNYRSLYNQALAELLYPYSSALSEVKYSTFAVCCWSRSLHQGLVNPKLLSNTQQRKRFKESEKKKKNLPGTEQNKSLGNRVCSFARDNQSWLLNQTEEWAPLFHTNSTLRPLLNSVFCSHDTCYSECSP